MPLLRGVVSDFVQSSTLLCNMSLSKFAVSAALLTLAQALPQKPDFNAIAAAPTVASGPSAFDGDADQIASLFTSFTVSGPTTAASTAAATAAAKRGIQKTLSLAAM